MKKLMNNPERAVAEAFDGLSLVRPRDVGRVDGQPILVRTEIPDGKVAVLVGGGSGHEPLFGGFVGTNLADGSVSGNFFAAPTPDTVLAATKAVHRGAGVLYVYGNYAGDNLNFDMAAELADDESIRVRTVRVRDDVATERVEDRRGIAGDVFVIKIAGGAAARHADLDTVAALAEAARDNTFSIGVALKPGSNPETGEFTFELPDDELEIGMGLHGEPGVARRALMSADELTDMMVDRLFEKAQVRAGETVAVLLNDLGSTTYMELLIANRRLQQRLSDAGVTVHDTVIGSFCTTQEMAGFSISLLKLEGELTELYDMEADSVAFTKRGRSAR